MTKLLLRRSLARRSLVALRVQVELALDLVGHRAARNCVSQVLAHVPSDASNRSAADFFTGIVSHFPRPSVVVGTPTVAKAGGASSAPGGGLAA